MYLSVAEINLLHLQPRTLKNYRSKLKEYFFQCIGNVNYQAFLC